MDFALLIPITLFICIAYAVKVVFDSRVRRRLVESNGSEELVKAMLQADEQSRRLGALKWGMVLTTVGLAFFIQQVTDLGPQDPATWGLMFVAAGVALIGYHVISARQR